MIMELCWISILMLIFNRHTVNNQLFVPGILLVYILSFFFNKLLDKANWPKICVTIINWLAWLIAMLLLVKVQIFSALDWTNAAWIFAPFVAVADVIYTFKPELLLLVSTAVLWWLGKWMASRHMNFNSSMAEFQLGLILLILIFLITSIAGIEVEHSILFTVPFFTSGLTGMSIAHTQTDRRRLTGISRLQWSWLIISSIALIIITGVIVAIIISPQLLQIIINGIQWIFQQILYLLSLLASLFPVDGTKEMIPPDAAMPSTGAQAEEFWRIPENIRLWLNILWTVIFVGFIVAAIWSISSQIYARLRKRLSTPGARTESIRGAFKADFIYFVKSIFRGIEHLYKSVTASIRRLFSSKEVSVNTIYKKLVKWGAKKGCPRQIFHTPYEYLEIVAEAMPAAREDLLYITQCFVGTSYGKLEMKEADMVELSNTWKRIRNSRYDRDND